MPADHAAPPAGGPPPGGSAPPGGGPPPDAVVKDLLFGAVLQRSVAHVARLGIADLLAAGPATAEDLAQRTGTHAPSLYRLLRYLAGAGLFEETAGRRFALTPLSQTLRADVPGSVRDFAVMLGEKWIWDAWWELPYSVATGGIAHDKVQGKGTFAYFEANPEAGAIFNRAMTGLSRAAVPAIAPAYDFSGAGTLVDIAGGHGYLLAGILKANPRLKGILFDLPYVIENAGALLKAEGVADRVVCKSGDFFKAVPSGGDVYMMKHIIHDWDDARCVTLLRNVGAAMHPDGRVLIIEMVVPEGNAPGPAKSLDMMMLLMEGGKERTPAEYEALYAAAGLRLTRIIPTPSPYSIVEGARA